MGFEFDNLSIEQRYEKFKHLTVKEIKKELSIRQVKNISKMKKNEALETLANSPDRFVLCHEYHVGYHHDHRILDNIIRFKNDEIYNTQYGVYHYLKIYLNYRENFYFSQSKCEQIYNSKIVPDMEKHYNFMPNWDMGNLERLINKL